jgi:hypothetical protein
MAFISFWLHYHAVELYNQYEEFSKTGKEVFRTHVKHPLQILFGILFGYCGSRRGRVIALSMLIALWVMFFCYYVLIAKFFAEALVLNIVNITAAIFTSISFLQALYRIFSDFPNWCSNSNSDLLATTGGCWELVLAGTVLTHLVLK